MWVWLSPNAPNNIGRIDDKHDKPWHLLGGIFRQILCIKSPSWQHPETSAGYSSCAWHLTPWHSIIVEIGSKLGVQNDSRCSNVSTKLLVQLTWRPERPESRGGIGVPLLATLYCSHLATKEQVEHWRNRIADTSAQELVIMIVVLFFVCGWQRLSTD